MPSPVSSPLHCAAVDLGATSGRVILGTWHAGELVTQEIYRFSNQIHRVGEHDYWDLAGMWTHLKMGLTKAAAALPEGERIASVGVDTWGVDHVLLSAEGRLVFPAHAYRDPRTRRGLEELTENSRDHLRIYKHTGIPAVFYNTSLQLAETVRSFPEMGTLTQRCLLLPDYFNYLLSGRMANEVSIASTTQLLDLESADWSPTALDHFNIPSHWFKTPIKASTRLGEITSLPNLRGTAVVAVPGHDTACAYEALPSHDSDDDLFISSGTWSLVGFKSDGPLNSPAALAAGVCNERTGDGRFRPLRNIIGLWLLEELLKAFPDRPNNDNDWRTLLDEARVLPAPEQLLDVTDPAFTNPVDMKSVIDAHLRQINAPLPSSLAGYVRLIADSLGREHGNVLKQFADLSGQTFQRILMVGGGAKNQLLCQATADAAGVPVVALQVEGSALGNLGSQLIALGALKSFADFREKVIHPLPSRTFRPRVNSTL